MSLRTILVPLFDLGGDHAALTAALDLARRFGAHLVGLSVRADTRALVAPVQDGLPRAVIDDLLRAAELEVEHRCAGACALFTAACTAAGVPLAERPPGPGRSSAHWREAGGRVPEVIPTAARLADLVVFGRGLGWGALDPDRAALEATLLGSRRPLLLMPPTATGCIGQTVAIAWNGGAEAAGAVAGALPLLERAAGVRVLTAETARTRAEAGPALADHLAWHGITCRVRPVEAAAGEPIGAALLRTAGEIGADLLVMGGYGRARLSELVLGGVTRHVLGHATLPVLLAH